MTVLHCRNTIITDASFQQFILVNKAASKWKKKIEKKPEPAVEEFKINILSPPSS